MKELLDQLESKISALLDEREVLRGEIEELRGEHSRALSPLRDEIASLKAELAEEQAVREAATQRIDALLLRVKERIPE